MVLSYKQINMTTLTLLTSVFTFGALALANATATGPLAQGQAAPIFTAADAAGKPFVLEGLRGRRVLFTKPTTCIRPAGG